MNHFQQILVVPWSHSFKEHTHIINVYNNIKKHMFLWKIHVFYRVWVTAGSTGLRPGDHIHQEFQVP